METSTAFSSFEVESKWLIDREKRLNAFSYSADAAKAQLLIDRLGRNGVEIRKLDYFIAKVFYPSRFKRIYSKSGTSFLSSKDIFDIVPVGKKIKNAKDEYIVDSGWIFVTQSGSVGRILISTKFMKNVAVSEHVIRVIPLKKTPLGYLYAYLSSKIGQSLLLKNIFGGVVDEIEPNHVGSLPTPRIPELEEEINQKILEAHRLREEAQELLLKAEEMLYSELGLPEIDEDDVEYFGGEKGRIVKSFEIKVSELNLRLDASYHLPILQQIEANLSKSRFKDTKFGNVIDKIFIPTRFKRPYVTDSNAGVPFLQGSHIPQIKPMDVKYLWSGTKHLENILIKKNWVLMTRSGTVGRIGIVRNGWEDWAASEHVLRIIIKLEVHPGYIAAFLSSPYGEYQIKGKIYGAVVDEIGEQDTSLIEEINMILPPKDIQDKIGNLVFEGYDKRDNANQIEDEAIKLLERRLKEIAEGKT